jgi:hemin uptake protein HemP
MTTDRGTPPPFAPRSTDAGAVPAPTRTGAGSMVRVNSTQLFGAALEIQIDHHGTLYRLKQTALGKLILTK